MKSRKITFENAQGSSLSAKIDLPESVEPRAYALFAHCFTCTKNINAVRRISHGLTDAAIGVLSFDFTGLGESEGEFSQSGFGSQTADLVSAAAFMTEELGSGPTILVGHSLGGTAALYAAREIDGVAGVATIGAPADPEHVTKLFRGEIDEIEELGQAEVSIGGRPFWIRNSFLEDLRRYPPEQWLGELRSNTLVMHSPRDNVVGIDNAERIFKAVRHPRSYVSLDTADHLLSQPEDASYAATMIGAWARKFVPAADEAAAAAQPGEQGGWVTPSAGYTMAAEIGRTPYEVRLSNGRHRAVADEPESAGGGDRGGNPYYYLLAALGSCTVMTVRLYADRKGWGLERASAQLRHKKVKATELGFTAEEAAAAKGQADHIEMSLAFEGDLSDEQRSRLLEIAHRCPVHRSLSSPTKIDIELV